jgi:hypothetical protein
MRLRWNHPEGEISPGSDEREDRRDASRADPTDGGPTASVTANAENFAAAYWLINDVDSNSRDGRDGVVALAKELDFGGFASFRLWLDDPRK